MKEATKKQTSKAQPEGPQFTPQISTREERYYKHRAQRLVCIVASLVAFLAAALCLAFALELAFLAPSCVKHTLMCMAFEGLSIGLYKLHDWLRVIA